MNYLLNKEIVALFVDDMLTNSKTDLRSITITRPDKLGVCCVSTVTDTSLADIVKNSGQISSDELMSILSPSIRGG